MADARRNLIDQLAAQVGVAPLSSEEIEAVLDLAAQAAHGTGDRTAAPLASFLAGIAAASAEDRIATVNQVRDHAAQLAPGSEAQS